MAVLEDEMADLREFIEYEFENPEEYLRDHGYFRSPDKIRSFIRKHGFWALNSIITSIKAGNLSEKYAKETMEMIAWTSDLDDECKNYFNAFLGNMLSHQSWVMRYSAAECMAVDCDPTHLSSLTGALVQEKVRDVIERIIETINLVVAKQSEVRDIIFITREFKITNKKGV